MIATTTRQSSWQEHYRDHVNPTLMTKLLRKAVPVLSAMDWTVTKVREGFCQSVLPLSGAATNQHGTHQAAVIGLSADYTGGIALASLLHGVPFAGIHRCDEDESASLWLAEMKVRYRAPSTGHLTAECQIDDKTRNMIVQRFESGKRVLATLPIIFHSNGTCIAEAEMKYFAQWSRQLRPSIEHPRMSPIFENKLKASARMIAGVRAQQSQAARWRVDCPHAKTAAGPHGMLLAQQLQAALPELTEFVAARTLHADATLRSMPNVRQVVLLGAGLDMRPYRFSKELPNVTWFELDLPPMLAERERVLSQFEDPQLVGMPKVKRHSIAVDFNHDRIDRLLRQHDGFDASLPTLFIYEGCSMYFDQSLNRSLLESCCTLMKHDDSRLWFDIVKECVIDDSSDQSSVKKFVQGMADLGEKFVFGSDDPQRMLPDDEVIVENASSVLGLPDPVYDLYQFARVRVAGRKTS